MKKSKRDKTRIVSMVVLGGLIFLPAIVQAAPPVVKTVPWVATNPLIPHDTWSGKAITLKGTSDVQGANIQYTWDFGDGSAVATGTVSNGYVVEATHTYTGTPGTIFAARLTVENTSTGETGSKAYYVAIQNQTLDVEVNVAIDEGLWYLHKTQYRYSSGGVDRGYWNSGYAGGGYYSIWAVNVNAFEVNGHVEATENPVTHVLTPADPSNPYVETVARGMRELFARLVADPTRGVTSQTNPHGTFSPDHNGNGQGVRVNQTNYYYQGGILMDAIVASGTPSKTASTGGTGIVGKPYKEIVQDMVDLYAWGQYDYSPVGGGWRYSDNQGPDNSACQWAAIGILAAEREWNCTVNPIVKSWNQVWLNYSHHSSGWYGYTGLNNAWGVIATTPSGMVQCAMSGIGRGNTLWDSAEAYMRGRFCAGAGPTSNPKDYYYGLFSLVKSMLLHDSNADGVAEPIAMLGQAPAVPIDWYHAQASQGDACDGVARTLVNDQSAGGYWRGHSYSGDHYPFETAWAIIMLNRTIFASGAPVAVAQAIPNPGVVGQIITFDGSGSFHQDASKNIVSWEWDLDNDGAYDDATGPIATRSFGSLGSFVVGLQVTDDASPPVTDQTTVTALITTPPVAPTADAGGPYVFCPQTQPWFLDGTGSNNPDEGNSEPGQPGDTIQSYAWDLDGDGQFDDAIGATPDVTAFFTALGTGSYLVQLRVTDTTATSFPSSGFGDLSDTDSAQVVVKAASDQACSCVDDLTARAKDGKIQLVWTHTGAASYNVYRSTVSGGPYLFVANTASTYSTYLDSGLTNGVTYYYVVREAAANTNELCQSNEASATPTARVRSR